MKYEVFARINQGDETLHIGNVRAQSDRLARMYAHNTFDEEDWDFLAVVREENLIEVTGKQPTMRVGADE
ncbi:phenylacetic acid degradation PaaB family protein [Halalkalicoccus subterraneus]|uniref:phenylacetic acid degradation PaaB family protein n=1 Tax=Halalkalicoccus subterraneus TaxID=2675002 RepID=UPI000EFD9EC1|nr:phenylacetic acid degradation PaaB family protein [Halalkalicoccus subterraneus]